MRVPDDISVVGMDDIDAAGLLIPGLTTVDLHGEELGELGIAAMATMLRGIRWNPGGWCVRTWWCGSPPAAPTERPYVRTGRAVFRAADPIPLLTGSSRHL